MASAHQTSMKAKLLTLLLFTFSGLSPCAQAAGGRSGNEHTDELNAALREKKVVIRNLVSTPSQPAFEIERSGEQVFDIYCYDGPKRSSLRHIWMSPHFQVSPKGKTPDYQLFVGHNESEVYKQQKTQGWLYLPWQLNSVNIEPFNRTCIGVDINIGYLVHFKIIPIHYLLVLRMCLGLILFFGAKKLSKNILFYYGTGISLGLVASALIAVFIFSRLVPRKAGAAWAVLVGGWSVVLYILQYMWENMQSIVERYKIYIFAYFCTTVLISFGVLYYKGPITNYKALNLMQWTMQLMGLALVYSGTQLPEVSIMLVLLLLLLQNMPLFLFRKVTRYWKVRFPPKVRLLTEEEYILQGQEETRKALEELRQYCRSPQCDAWKTLSHVQSPSRFAHFVEGQSHISDEELDQYDRDPCPRMAYDEEDMDTTY